MNPYEILGVKNDCTQQEIKRAYRKKAREEHPDHGGSREKFQMIALAYEVLSSPERREHFDNFGSLEPSEMEKLLTAIAKDALLQFDNVEVMIREVQNLQKSASQRKSGAELQLALVSSARASNKYLEKAKSDAIKELQDKIAQAKKMINLCEESLKELCGPNRKSSTKPGNTSSWKSSHFHF